MKKRKPTDATIRNVRAANKKIAELTKQVEELHCRIADMRRDFVKAGKKR